MTELLIIFGCICLVQLLFIILLKKPKKILGSASKNKRSVQILKWIMIASMALLYVFLFIQLDKYHEPHPLPNIPYDKQSVYPTIAPGTVEQIGGRKTSTITNLYFLYLGQDKSKEKLSEVAYALRGQYCESLCIINLYDDKSAFSIDLERVDIVDEKVMEDWNRKNYVYVADHYLGYLDAIHEASFAYYPFKDGYYKKAKAGSTDGY